MSALSIENLRKTYGRVVVIDDLTLTVAPASFVSLLGPSGSGKTTILRCIAGFEAIDAGKGRIRLGEGTISGDGRDVPPERRGMGMVFQNYAVWPHMDVRGNVAFPLVMQKRPPHEIKTRVDEALAMVRLSGLDRRYAHELSGGQQQRVALARALVMRPRLLLLDEPLSNLDALLREELGAEIRRLQKELGLTAILVTHDQKEALSLSDRIVVLEGGRIVADGEPEALYRDPPTPFVAEFLAGGQRLTGGRVFLPRRWRPLVASDQAQADAVVLEGRIEARIFRGSEYEYLVRSAGFEDSVRFFGAMRLEPGAAVRLAYESL
jgi:ABC-type Fe3+/spermidine/putrescine transport system ATPase subunit